MTTETISTANSVAQFVERRVRPIRSMLDDEIVELLLQSSSTESAERAIHAIESELRDYDEPSPETMLAIAFNARFAAPFPDVIAEAKEYGRR